MDPCRNNASRLLIVDGLRGLAAVVVCLAHFLATEGVPLASPAISQWFELGEQGVTIFFVISGFIIPWALSSAHYRWSDFPVFAAKRVIRLDPPYLAVIAIVILTGYLANITPGYRGDAFAVTGSQLGLHMFYGAAVFQEAWLSPVFWTLGIELQFYLLAALLLPLWKHRSNVVFFLTSLPLLLGRYLHADPGIWIANWLPVFLMGILAFRLRARLINKLPAGIALLALGALASQTSSLATSAFGVGTAVCIATVTLRPSRWLLFLGAISYPLYLLHVPIGSRIIHLGLRIAEGPFARLLVLAVALAATLSAAWLLHRWVEMPAQRWARGLKFRAQAPATAEVGPELTVEGLAAECEHPVRC